MLDAVLALNETDTKVFDFASQAAPPADEPAGHITVPNAHLLFNGDFQRVGTNDLKIVGDDGASFFIRDYFAADKLSHLISPEGATLSASVVAALAGPLAPGQSAQAGAQPAGQPVIGRVDALSGSCTVVRNGVSVALNIGDTVRKGDVVQTAGGSAVAIVFADGSTFSLNANARMVLDEFVYNAGGAGNSALISLVQGTFSFVAGQVAKTGDMRVDTPVATMGIRGTAVLVEISANDGQTRFSVMTEPDGTTGSFNLYDKTSGTLIGTVSSSQIGWLVTPAGPLQVVAQQVQKTPAQLAQELGIVQQIFTIFNNNQQNPFTPDPNDPGRRGDNPNDPNPQTAQGGGGGSGGLFAGGDTSEGATPGIVNPLPPSGTHVVKLPPLPGAPPPIIPEVVTVVVTPNAAPVAVNDPDGSSGGGDVIENDSDPEGSVIAVKSVQHIVFDTETGQEAPAGPVVQVDADGEQIEGTYGTLTLRADGTYTFTPNEAFKQLADGEQKIEKFQYTISDPFGATATAVLSINLTGVNDAPVVAHPIDDASADVGSAFSFALEDDTFTDIDHNTALTYTATLENGDPLPEWLTFDAETLTFSGTPPSGTEGETFIIKVTASDGSPVNGGLSVSDQFVLTINETATDDTASMTENQVLFVDVLGNDFPGTQTSKTLTDLGEITITGPNGVPLGTPAIVIENNQIRVTPGTAFDALAKNETATITVPYTMTANGVTYDAVAIITVTGTNDTPYFSSFPQGYQHVGTINPDDSFDDVAALELTTSGASVSEIEHFLGLNEGTLASISTQDAGSNLRLNPTEGAAIAFDLTLNAGESISFTWNFASVEYQPYNDFAFISFAPSFGDKLADIYTVGDNIPDNFQHSSGWHEYTFTATSSGTHRLGIGIVDTGDTAVDSQFYISGFTGLGFKRTATESDPAVTFNLLNGAIDPDTNDNEILSANVVDWSAKNDLGEEIPVPIGAVTVNGNSNSVTIDPEFFSSLSAGQSVTIVVNYDLSDGHTTTHNTATLVVNGEGTSNAPPVINIANAAIADTNLGTILSGVSVSDPDAALGETFHTKLVSQYGTLALANSDINNNFDDDPSDNAMVFDISLESIDQALQQGVIYSPKAAPGNSASPLIDTVTLTIEDGHGGTDSMNFIFSVYGESAVVLAGTNEKDVLFGTGHNDMLTGNGSADIFVFSHGNGHDTITDFVHGQDKIALYGIYEDYDDMIASGAFSNENLAPNQIDLGGGNVITLNGVTVSDLAANDFIFHQNGNLFV